MADLIYNGLREYIGDGTIDLDNDTFKILLLDDNHTPDATDDVPTDVNGDEVSSTGYTAGGVALSSVTWTRDGATVTFDAADAEWSGVTFDARYAVVYSDTATKLVCLLDFSSNQSPVAQTFIVRFNASGILTLS